MKKLTLFTQAHLEKLEHPEMPLDNWFATCMKNPIRVYVEKMKSVKKNLMAKKTMFRVSIQDPFWPQCQEAARSTTDFALLFKQLETRFPNSVIPQAPTDMKNANLLEIYLQKVADNPFFRNDVAFYDFVDGLFKEYRMTKKKDRKMSEGTLRWLQCVTEYPTVNSDDQYLEAVKQEFDLLDKNQKQLLKALGSEVDALARFEAATQEIVTSFEGILATERASEKKVPVNTSGTPPGEVGNVAERTINMTNKHKMALKRAYGSATFRRVLLDPMTVEMAAIQSWKKAIVSIKTKKRNYDRARDACDKEGDKATQALIDKKNERYIDYHKYRQGVFGFELERYKESRTVLYQSFFADFAKFNLRGASEMLKEWQSSGVELNRAEDEEFFQRNMNYASSVVSGKSFATKTNSVAQISQTDLPGLPAAVTTVSLLVTTTYNPKKRGHLKVAEGEILAAHKADNDMWMATNAKGKKGLVPATHVAVKSNRDTVQSQRPSQAQTLNREKHKTNLPPGITMPTFNEVSTNQNHMPRPSFKKDQMNHISQASGSVASEVENEENEDDVLDDWSVSEEGDENDDEIKVVPNTNRPKMSFEKNNESPTTSMKAPVKPKIPSFGLPPGLSFKVGKETATVPTNSKNHLADVKANAVVTNVNSEAKKPQSTNTQQPLQNGKPEVKGFNDPGQKPVIPSFGNPNPEQNFNPMQMKPMNFLADIQKGNAAKILKKVPEAEKSKEIGGKKDSNSKSVGEDSGKKTSSGGGGGLMGELQAKLKKKQV